MNRWLGPASVFLLLVASCQGENDLSASDPMQSSNTGGGGQVGVCERCFDERCGWEGTECASDPGCASWLTCARSCPAEDTGSVLESCLEDCPDPASSTGKTLRDVFVGCLLGNQGCCEGGSPAAEGGAGGLEGAAGSGGFYEDAGTDDQSLGPACAVQGCETCLIAVKEQKGCAVEDDDCASAMSDCYHDGELEDAKHCWTYLTRYGRCSGGEAMPEELACSYEVPPDSLALSENALSCAATYCPQCVSDTERACVFCQLEACPDEMAAVLSNLDAQELLWCRERCRDDADPPACNQACFAAHEAGTPAVVELYVCTQAACKQACAGT